jgi:hypothetical protein
MNDAYYRWLVDLLDDEYLRTSYQKLLYHLFTTEFIWEIDYDENRAAGGLNLRKLYGKEIGYPMFSLNCGCTVLEMMIALARKTDSDIMYDPVLGERTRSWFWIMMENLGLDIYDDYSYDPAAVDQILDIFMHHRYRADGVGGMFPCDGIGTDMRKTDLWWQLNQYLIENNF